MLRGVVALWRMLPNPLKWRMLALTHARFMVSVAGVLIDDSGRVLLLRHRLWQHQRWGLPGGYARRGERLENALAREVLEETALHIANIRLLAVRSGTRFWMEVFFHARISGGAIHLDVREVLAATFFTIDALPDDLPQADRALILHSLRENQLPRADIPLSSVDKDHDTR